MRAKGAPKGEIEMESNSKTSSTATHVTGLGEKSNAAYAAFAAILLGVVLVAGTGFAGSNVLHNAAHDARHAFAFPCH
jgi:cobalt transporter subunit CbtB